MARKVFYSFHYVPDNWRVATVRSIGSVEENKPASDNDWETVVGGGEVAIEKWIDSQMQGRSCAVVLVGEKTAGRKWINYEISKAWNKGMGVVGIRIHGLKNKDGYISNRGGNPFDHVTFSGTKAKLSTVVKCYNPQGSNSKERYAWISKYLEAAIDEAIRIRKEN